MVTASGAQVLALPAPTPMAKPAGVEAPLPSLLAPSEARSPLFAQPPVPSGPVRAKSFWLGSRESKQPPQTDSSTSQRLAEPLQAPAVWL